MSDIPSGLASISARLDDTPQARGAVDMAKRLRRAEALSKLAEMDALYVGNEGPTEVLEAAACARKDLGSAIDRHVTRSWWSAGGPTREECAEILNAPCPFTAAIDRHAALAVSAGYKGRDLR